MSGMETLKCSVRLDKVKGILKLELYFEKNE